MADSKYSNLARKQEFRDNDPFAELTRIMGFEPNGARPLPADDEVHRHLGIDLEQELMGGFGEVDAVSLDADTFVWDADEAGPEQDDIVAANDAEAAEAAWQAEDEEAAAPAPAEEPALSVEAPAAEADEQDFAFDAALDAELSREAESWVFDEEQAEPASSFEEEPAEFAIAEPLDPLADEAVDAEFEAVEIDLSDEFVPAGESEDQQGEALADEAIEIDFLDMDFGALDEAGKLVEDGIAAENFEEPQPVQGAATASAAAAGLEEELAVLLGRFPPSEDQDAAEHVGHDPENYDLGDFLEDATTEPEVAALEGEVPADLVHAAAAERQPEDDAALALEDALAEAVVSGTEPADEPLWQELQGDTAQGDILDELAAVEPVAAEPAAPAPAGHDPFAALAAMAASPVPQFSRVNLTSATPRAPEPRQDEVQPAMQAQAAAGEEDFLAGIDSIEIQEAAVAVADDLDLPEVDYQVKAAATEFDEFDHDLHDLLSEPQPAEPAAQPVASTGPAGFSEDELRASVERAFEEDEPLAVRPYEPAAVAAPASASAVSFAEAVAAPHADAPGEPEPDFGFDEAFGYDPDPEGYAQPPAKQGLLANRRNLMLGAAAVLGLVIVGGAGTFFLGGDSEGSAPALVRADEGPFKVRPENPGGATVPNQNREAYERVTTGPDQTPPVQEKLVSATEEPIDVATRIPAMPAKPAPETAADEPAAATPAAAEPAAEMSTAAEAGSPPPMVEDFTIPMKSEERLAPTPTAEEEAEASDIALVTPRKVQTFVVRPDGTMVPNEPPVQQASLPAAEDSSAAETLREAEPVEPAAAAAADETSQPAPADAASAEGAQPETMQAAAPAAGEPGTETGEAAGAIVTPSQVPIAPPRPADQPVEIVGEVRRDQVAAVEPQNQGAAAGGWSMQIASQPSAESAQATYANLASRYGEVIAGRGVNIVKAEVTGKGTYYRVRVPAGSRSEAIELCERYQSAGGSCFVAQ